MNPMNTFTKPAKPVRTTVTKVAREPKPAKVAKPKAVRYAAATIERTNATGNGFILHISRVGCADLGLVVGDKLVLGYHAQSGRVVFRKDNKNGDHVLNPYGVTKGETAFRLKTGITSFMAHYKLADLVIDGKVKDDILLRDIDGNEWATILINPRKSKSK
jgi:hypothetical protein